MTDSESDKYSESRSYCCHHSIDTRRHISHHLLKQLVTVIKLVDECLRKVLDYRSHRSCHRS